MSAGVARFVAMRRGIFGEEFVVDAGKDSTLLAMGCAHRGRIAAKTLM